MESFLFFDKLHAFVKISYKKQFIFEELHL